MIKKIFLLLTVVAASFIAKGQGNVIDQVVGVVGSKSILLSDVENQYLQMVANGVVPKDDFEGKCKILEELMLQKLLLNQGDLDSVKVTDAQVDNEVNRRLRYFVGQVGSEKKLEEYFKKSMLDIKNELTESIRDQMMMEEVQKKITGDIKVTPTEVRVYFNSIPKDSLPKMPAVVEVAQIVKKPMVTVEAKKEARAKIQELRDRIIKGEDFGKLAALYSEDPGSSKNRGELGFYSRGELYPPFEAVAFGLKDKELSDIVETVAGYHIIQMLERRGEQINVRHILIMPKVTPQAITNSQKLLDSIASLIGQKKMTFEEAAQKFSDDDTKNNGGIVLNPNTGNAKIEVDALGKYDPSLFFVVDKLRIGDISKPTMMQTNDGKQAYRIVKVNYRGEPHVSNLKDDYQSIQDAALAEKKQRTLAEWVTKVRSSTFVQVNGKYFGCDFEYKWF